MIILIYIFIVTIGLFENKFRILGYWDETVLLFGILAGVLIYLRKRLKTTVYGLTNFMIVVVLILLGILGNVLHPGIQSNKIAIIKDVIAFIKFPVLLMLLRNISWGKIWIHKQRLIVCSKVISLIWLCFAIIGYFTDIGVYLDDSTRLLKTYEFYYANCIYFAFICTAVCTVFINNSIKKYRIWILINIVLLILTQRSKIVFIAFLILVLTSIDKNKVMHLFKITKSKIKIRKGYFIFVGGVLAVIGWWFMHDRIAYYWQYGLSSARNALYIIGIELAKKYFPIGSGFGTFASFISGKYYSNVYYYYGLSDVLGLKPNAYNYISDTFWPYIYGQLGVAGIILYITLIYRLFKDGLKKIKEYDGLIAYLVLWIYAIVESLGEAFFTNTSAVTMAIILSFFIEKNSSKNYGNSKKGKSII